MELVEQPSHPVVRRLLILEVMIGFIPAATPPMVLLPAVRDAIRAVDDDPAPNDARPLSEQKALLLATQRSVGLLLVVSALIALTSSAIGTYGTAARALARRRPELGLRMALGASASNVRRFVLDKGLKPSPWASSWLSLRRLRSVVSSSICSSA